MNDEMKAAMMYAYPEFFDDEGNFLRDEFEDHITERTQEVWDFHVKTYGAGGGMSVRPTRSETLQAWRERREKEQAEQAERQRKIREAAIQRATEMELKHQEEQAAIGQDFPQWLPSLGQQFNLHTYNQLAELMEYIKAVLAYAESELDGKLPIRQIYQEAAEGVLPTQPPLYVTRLFFEELLKTLADNEILVAGRGSRARVLTDGWMVKLSK